MSFDKKNCPEYLFEVSWEVCNKMGGIHTVIATKALNLKKELNNNHILIGPDVWMGTDENPEFTEDHILYRSWRLNVLSQGLRVRVGRWNIPASPIAILVDFTPFISKKDEISAKFWETFKLDSLNGGWDYLESLLFGYAAGKVIESFVDYNLQPNHRIVAQFHEWMAGAGLLYIKQENLPIATVFTTHATVVGRCLACNNVPLYDSFDHIIADDRARDFNVVAKHSVEKCAATNADIFTTVSEITAKECERFLGRKVDIVTPNGFENSFVPSDKDFEKCEKRGRDKLVEIASLMSNESYDNPFIIGLSGRYEYKNKGIDAFIDALSRIKNSDYDGRTILAFIMVPGGHNGPNKELVSKMETPSNYRTNVSHYLSDHDYDPVMSQLRHLNLNNESADKVKVFFIPSYLNGNDGVLNMPYYDLLIGLDLSVFPSYYEPWGYTPLESLAFKVPTITTTLAGFGLWVNDYFKKAHPSITVIERNDSNYDILVNELVLKMIEISALSKSDMSKYKENAKEVSEIALWDNNIKYYNQAYSDAIVKIIGKRGDFPKYKEEKKLSYKKKEMSRPNWNRVLVTRQIPDRLKYLDIISKNMWWCWNEEAIDLFKSIDRDSWRSVHANPIALLDLLSLGRYKELENDKKFLEQLDKVAKIFNDYMEAKGRKKSPSIAYFSMEYGLDTSLKIYSGGLGILAGDYLKESSDMEINMTGIGLLYRYGYFTQKLSSQGGQEAYYEAQDFLKIPAVPIRDKNDKWMTITVAFPGRNVHARLWRVDVGRTELYLLDTDFEDNLPEDRQITHHLYGGDWENRLKQEILLGIGGIRALRALGIKSEVYHCNEGHAAFIGLERLRECVENDNLSYLEALEVVRASALFTTHTPVPAGHDAFSEDMLRAYIYHYTQSLKIDWHTLMGLGKIYPENTADKFSMSNLACNLSQEVNGVSWLHGKVSQDILSELWPGFLPEELHVGYVTNGVHYPTWTASRWKTIHSRVFGEKFATHHYDKECFQGIYEVEDSEIWGVRKELRAKLIDSVSKRLDHYSPQQIVKIRKTLSSDVLTIGFARRFATYKRANLLFRDLAKLNEIVNNPERPVQFLFAGKAHPADGAGQDLIKRIVEISKLPEFIGKVVFVPNYDINLGKLLVQGVDVWMNTPTRPLEASGTSGEKGVMNGVMHFSVLDGWWVEGFKQDAGWALPMERTYDDQNFQDELDAATIYNILENDISETFYDIDAKSKLPVRWIKIIKNTIAKVACDFTTNRMMSDYVKQYYDPLYARSKSINMNDYAVAREIALWKKKMRLEWPHIEVREFVRNGDSQEQLLLGRETYSEVEVFVGEVNPENICIEVIYALQDAKGMYRKQGEFDYEFVSCKDGVAKYKCEVVPSTTGAYYVATRVYAKHKLLPHKQDFELVRWL